jgi:hypothetical protein
MAHIPLPRYLAEPRFRTGRSPKLPVRNQQAHGRQLEQQLRNLFDTVAEQRDTRPRELPPLPEAVQLLVESSAARGKPILTQASLPKGWNLEVVEERPDGILTAISRDPNLAKLQRSVGAFRQDERTATGRLRFGATKIAALQRIVPADRALKLGEELLLQVPIRRAQAYLVDIEIAAGSSVDDHAQRRQQFGAYLRDAGAVIVGTGAIVEEDYALFRARITGRVLLDLVDNHPHVLSIDTPPSVELEGMELLEIDLLRLPGSLDRIAAGPPIVVIDGGVVSEQPLLRQALHGPTHRSFIPGTPSVIDGGIEGHGTATASVAAMGSLRRKLLEPVAGDQVLPVAVARVLDDHSALPESVNMKSALPEIARQMHQQNRARVFNHSLASRAPFNRQRMSVWAEALDRTAYDNGGAGYLFIVATGNIDGGVSPSTAELEAWLARPGHPRYLTQEKCRLRNPAQAINALTVGAYVPRAGAAFAQRQNQNRRPVAQNGAPSPFTRTGPGYLGEVKPEVVEEGGNYYLEGGTRLRRNPQLTDVAVANSQFARDGRLVKFVNGTSVAAPKVAHLAGLIERELPNASVDLIRALIVNAAQWPERLANTEDTLRVLGFGVPDPDRALAPGGVRCLITVDDRIVIGKAHYFRIPFPTNLFDRSPETRIRVSVTLAYRAPVRKTNAKYRGTILEWGFSKIGEGFDQFRRRCSTVNPAAAPEEEAELEDEPIGNWNWIVKQRLRTRGTVQKDWFEAPASDFQDEMFLCVIGRRGWLSKETQDAGFEQAYAVAIAIEVAGVAIPIHERIEALVRVQVPIRT